MFLVSNPSSTLFSETKSHTCYKQLHWQWCPHLRFLLAEASPHNTRNTHPLSVLLDADPWYCCVNSVLKAHLVHTSCLILSGGGNRQYKLQRCCDRPKRFSSRHTSQCLLYYAPSPHLNPLNCEFVLYDVGKSSVELYYMLYFSILWFIDTASFPPCI